MDAWMHGCMDAWLHSCMYARRHAWRHARKHAWMHGCLLAAHGLTVAHRKTATGSSNTAPQAPSDSPSDRLRPNDSHPTDSKTDSDADSDTQTATQAATQTTTRQKA